MKRFSLFVLLFGLCISLFAQDDLIVRPSGRILIDGGFFESNDAGLNNGITIPDFRVGTKASYRNFNACVDLGYTRQQVRLKDIYIEGQFGDKNTVTLGYFYHQFGLQGASSSSKKITMLEPGVDGVFVGDRQIGIMWIHNHQAYWSALSLTVEEEAMKKTTQQIGKQAYGIVSRMLYRPFREDGKIFHVGFSWAYDTPKYHEDEALNHRSFTLHGYFPTQLSSITTIQTTIPEAENRWRFTPEICMASGRIGIEAQYYHMLIQRKEQFSTYQANGGYVQLRGLLKGPHYKYNEANSWIIPQDEGTWECVLGYSCVNLNHKESGINGGNMKDLSLTLNHYLNKHITWRLRYAYTDVNSNAYNLAINSIQTRIQFLF